MFYIYIFTSLFRTFFFLNWLLKYWHRMSHQRKAMASLTDTCCPWVNSLNFLRSYVLFGLAPSLFHDENLTNPVYVMLYTHALIKTARFQNMINVFIFSKNLTVFLSDWWTENNKYSGKREVIWVDLRHARIPPPPGKWKFIKFT